MVCAKLRRVQSEVKLRSPVAGWPGAGDHSYVRHYHKYCRSHAPVSVPVTDALTNLMKNESMLEHNQYFVFWWIRIPYIHWHCAGHVTAHDTFIVVQWWYVLWLLLLLLLVHDNCVFSVTWTQLNSVSSCDQMQMFWRGNTYYKT